MGERRVAQPPPAPPPALSPPPPPPAPSPPPPLLGSLAPQSPLSHLMHPPRSPPLPLPRRRAQFMDKRISVLVQGGRKVTGVLRGFDIFLNLVVDESADESVPADKVPMGMVVSPLLSLPVSPLLPPPALALRSCSVLSSYLDLPSRERAPPPFLPPPLASLAWPGLPRLARRSSAPGGGGRGGKRGGGGEGVLSREQERESLGANAWMCAWHRGWERKEGDV